MKYEKKKKRQMYMTKLLKLKWKTENTKLKGYSKSKKNTITVYKY